MMLIPLSRAAHVSWDQMSVIDFLLDVGKQEKHPGYAKNVLVKPKVPLDVILERNRVVHFQQVAAEERRRAEWAAWRERERIWSEEIEAHRQKILEGRKPFHAVAVNKETNA